MSRRWPPEGWPDNAWRSLAPAVVAGGLAVAGVAAALIRPTAGPSPADVPLTRFAPAVLDAVRSYQVPRDVGLAVQWTLGLAVPVAAVASGPGRRLVARLAGGDGGAWRGGLVAAGVAVVVSAAQLPVGVWLGYLHDTRWGFNTAEPLAWARDWLVASGLGWGVAFVTGAGLLAVVRRWPDSWHWRASVLGAGLVAVLTFAHPLVVAPLFYDTSPLPPGPARERVAAVLEEAGHEQLPISVADASRRTTKVNAFVSGLGPSREVVVFDTLLALPPRQVAAVVAHELAHREHLDLARSVLLAGAGLVAGMGVLRRLWDAPWVRGLVGARSRRDPRLVAVAVAAAALLQAVGQPAALWVSRRAEAAADARAMELSGDPAALIRIARAFTVRDLARPDRPAALQLLWGTHPTVTERIRAAAGFAAARDIPLPDLESVQRAEQDLRHRAVDGPNP